MGMAGVGRHQQEMSAVGASGGVDRYQGALTGLGGVLVGDGWSQQGSAWISMHWQDSERTGRCWGLLAGAWGNQGYSGHGCSVGAIAKIRLQNYVTGSNVVANWFPDNNQMSLSVCVEIEKGSTYWCSCQLKTVVLLSFLPIVLDFLHDLCLCLGYQLPQWPVAGYRLHKGVLRRKKERECW